MTLRSELAWRRGMFPDEIAQTMESRASDDRKEAFVEYIQSTAGDPPRTWPVDTGWSRDNFKWYKDLLFSAWYAPYPDAHYGGVLKRMWKSLPVGSTVEEGSKGRNAGTSRQVAGLYYQVEEPQWLAGLTLY